jgi:predicted RNase H-like nuclease
MQPKTFIGFDSAWADNSATPGAICAIRQMDDEFETVKEPHLVHFDAALEFIRSVHNPIGVTIIGFDQPTLAPNATGCRPVERAVGSLVSWLGGGVQPANQKREGIFDDSAPVWKFLHELNAIDDPERACIDEAGLFIVEVFPALALPSMNPAFFGRLAAPRYNPNRRRTFNINSWIEVAQTARTVAERLECEVAAAWCSDLTKVESPQKSDQDKLDSIICMLIVACWRLDSRDQLAMIGDLSNGYMITPVSQNVRERLTSEM